MDKTLALEQNGIHSLRNDRNTSLILTVSHHHFFYDCTTAGGAPWWRSGEKKQQHWIDILNSLNTFRKSFEWTSWLIWTFRAIEKIDDQRLQASSARSDGATTTMTITTRNSVELTRRCCLANEVICVVISCDILFLYWLEYRLMSVRDILLFYWSKVA